MLLKTFLFTILLLALSAQTLAQSVQWTNNYGEAEKIARETGKPMLLDFTAEWCGLCRVMDKIFWTRADVVEVSKQFVNVKIDGEKEALLAKRFGVDSFPTVVVADSWALGIDSHTGFGQNADRVILSKAVAFPKDFTELISFGNALEKDAADGAAIEKFADFYGERNLYDASIKLYKRLLKTENDPTRRERAMYNLALNAFKLGRPAESLVYYEILQKEYPKSPRADAYQYGVFITNLRKRNYAEAEKQLTKLKNDFPDSKILLQAERELEKQKTFLK